jgi:hypothetical protein
MNANRDYQVVIAPAPASMAPAPSSTPAANHNNAFGKITLAD